MNRKYRFPIKELADWPDLVTLVPFSGIQMLDFGFNLESTRFRSRFLERTVARHDTVDERELEPLPQNDDEADNRIDEVRENDPLDYVVSGRQALEVFLGKWIPVPILRLRKEPGQDGDRQFDQGPTNWARIRVVELDSPDPRSSHTHRVQLAIDTSLVNKNRTDNYLAPEEDDSANSRVFRFVSDHKHMGFFLRRALRLNESGTDVDLQHWVSEWLKHLFEQFLSASRRNRPLDDGINFEHWARYIAFLKLIDHMVGIPGIRFVNTVSARDGMPFVEVDLVLDVGNSRTCGIFVERFPNDTLVEMTKSFKLEMRDLSKPEFHYRDLVESRVEFSELSFGDDRFASRSGRRDAFVWPSFVRIGAEAIRLVQSETGTETVSGLSSPKRYFWDDSPRVQDWRFHHHDDLNELPRSARSAMRFLNEAGDVIQQVQDEIKKKLRDPKKTSTVPAIRPRFSRSSLFGFMLAELISHALMQINDPASKLRREQSDLPRRLNRIILTLPSATLAQEQAIIRSRAEGALDLIWSLIDNDGKGVAVPNRPKLVVEWDEASCTQLVYLYSEISQKFGASINDYMNLIGEKRKPSDNPRAQLVPSIRVACIDIGGGTTDLMVTTYFGEHDRALKPRQEFREGFRVAGDDLLEHVIKRIVLPAMIEDIENAGGWQVREMLAERFGGDVGGMDQKLTQLRRQFGLRILAPLGLSLLEQSEHSGPDGVFNIALADLIPTREPEDYELPDDPDAPDPIFLDLPPELVGYVEDAARQCGAKDWRLADFKFTSHYKLIDAAARDVLSIALGNMAEIIDSYGCDILLLSGRPSRMPCVRSIIENFCVVQPNRLISMHDFQPGLWYPYREPASQKIGDPKTTVAVGGMLTALAENRIANFKVETRAFQMKSTVRYIGEMDMNGQIKQDRVLFSDIEFDRRRRDAEATATLKMFSPVYIGSRQLPLERWTTTPLYLLDFANPNAAKHGTPFDVTLEKKEFTDDADDSDSVLRREAASEELEPTEVVDAEGGPMRSSEITLQLQTLGPRNSYWLDTGIFDLG